MRCLQGKKEYTLDTIALAAHAARYDCAVLDIGTGDGRYVRHLARTHAAWLCVGLDACCETMRDAARQASPNALYVVANAHSLPHELRGLATHITVNFPWGSLLTGLLDGAPALLDGMRTSARPGATLEVRLNSGALAEVGWTLETGGAQLVRMLRASGFVVRAHAALDAAALRACPTTWAKRLAYGRDPHALYVRAELAQVASPRHLAHCEVQ